LKATKTVDCSPLIVFLTKVLDFTLATRKGSSEMDSFTIEMPEERRGEKDQRQTEIDCLTPYASGTVNDSRQQQPPAATSSPIDVDSLTVALSRALRFAQTNPNLPRLPTYSGEADSVEWTAFLESFEEIIAINGWSDHSKEFKATLLRSSLIKRAADTFGSLANDVKRDYHLARAELTRIFVNPAKCVMYQNEFDNKIQ
jgi:hypothetical protein